jgi:O-antigen/teichoic acid export membrane protein
MEPRLVIQDHVELTALEPIAERCIGRGLVSRFRHASYAPLATPARDDAMKIALWHHAFGLRPLLRTAAVLGFGRILARLLMLAAIPLLARVYNAEAFGLFGVYNTAIAVISVAAALCYEQAIVPVRSDRQAAALLYLSLLLAVAISLLLQIIVFLGFRLIRHFGPVQSLAPIILVMPAATGVNAIVLILLQWANRTHRDHVMSSNSVLRAGCMVGLQAVAGYFAMGGMGLVLGQLAASLIAAAVLAVRISWPVLQGKHWFLELRNTARDLRDFPIFSFPRALLEAAAGVVVMGSLAALFGPSDVGYYWMAQRIVSIPSQVIDEPMRQVFYRAASLSLAKGEGVIRPLIVTVGIRAAVVIPFITLLLLLANVVFVRLLGPSWAGAAFYARLMAAGWMAGEIATPFFALPVLLHRQRFQLIAEVISQSAKIAVILIAYLLGSFALCIGLLAAQDVLFAIGFAIALFWPKAIRTLAAGRATPNADSLAVVSRATT